LNVGLLLRTALGRFVGVVPLRDDRRRDRGKEDGDQKGQNPTNLHECLSSPTHEPIALVWAVSKNPNRLIIGTVDRQVKQMGRKPGAFREET
jgi:hypothetical protein